MPTVNISIIGRKGHAGRHIANIRSSPGANLHHVFYPFDAGPDHADLPLTKDFNKILTSDVVIISSPTDTHLDYLKRLRDYAGYVLLEKPAVTNLAAYHELAEWPEDLKRRIKINYNFKHSIIAKNLKEFVNNAEFGAPLNIQIQTGQGLAFTKDYQGSWRADLKRSFGVAELVGVHYINLLIDCFGEIKTASGMGQYGAERAPTLPPDSCRFELLFAGPVTASLFHSYASPFNQRIVCVKTNGVWQYDGDEIAVIHPRDTFDGAGRFVSPPKVETQKIPFAEAWSQSLKAGLDDFMRVACERTAFDPATFDLDLSSILPVLELRERFEKER